MDPLVSVIIERRTGSWFGHGCSGHCMLLEHKRNYDLGMDALVGLCFWNTSGIRVWAWMLWLAKSSKDERIQWFGHGCSGQDMLLEHERDYGWAVDALERRSL